MIINQINYRKTFTGSTVTSKDILYNKIGYGSDGKIVGNAPIDDGIIEGIFALPTSAYWRSVCYGNGKYVVVAYNSTIAVYSTDGITWTQTTLPASTYWQSVCYGNGKFVAVAYNSTISAYVYAKKYSIQMLN